MNCNTTRSHPLYFYSRPCGRGDIVRHAVYPIGRNFYSRHCGRGDWIFRPSSVSLSEISTHAPAGGATLRLHLAGAEGAISTHAPAGGATDTAKAANQAFGIISTHAPAGGATWTTGTWPGATGLFLLTPLREGRRKWRRRRNEQENFYSRPCGRGDYDGHHDPRLAGISTHAPAGGATFMYCNKCGKEIDISTHAPAGGATRLGAGIPAPVGRFLLTPLREGRPALKIPSEARKNYFYSRPCGRGDGHRYKATRNCIHFYSRPCGRGDAYPGGILTMCGSFLLTPLREGRRNSTAAPVLHGRISTHAPAGGATAIFHKSVMRFCGKLPKDDTVLCLASFGFPRRDPKAVYLAWISCANLPQKCVRQGLALKDQGTSCFHEGLASHAFDPVLV